MSCPCNAKHVGQCPDPDFRIMVEPNHVAKHGNYENVLVQDTMNGRTYMYDSQGNFLELASGESNNSVTSVNGLYGTVVLTPDQITDTVSAKKFVSAEQKIKLDGIEDGAQVNTVNSVNGLTQDIMLNADNISDSDTIHKFTTATNLTKLAGIATAATANDTDANLKNRANHTGTQSADTIVDGTTNKAYTATEKTKLAGIATAATANDTDANLKARANHTGTQLASTISDIDTAGWVAVPSTAGSAGVAGQKAYDNGFLYVCVATNTWQRVALVTF